MMIIIIILLLLPLLLWCFFAQNFGFFGSSLDWPSIFAAKQTGKTGITQQPAGVGRFSVKPLVEKGHVKALQGCFLSPYHSRFGAFHLRKTLPTHSCHGHGSWMEDPDPCIPLEGEAVTDSVDAGWWSCATERMFIKRPKWWDQLLYLSINRHLNGDPSTRDLDTSYVCTVVAQVIRWNFQVSCQTSEGCMGTWRGHHPHSQ